MASPFTLINLLLLSQTLLFFSSQLNVAYVYAAATDHYNVIDPNWLLPKSNCSTSTGGSTVGSQKLRVTYRYGPCSPNGKGKEIPTSDQILLHDTTRVHSMNGRMSQLHLHPTAENDNIISNSSRSIGNGNYVVTIGFGTPKRDYNVIFDTGSDITWIQCQPCSQSCYSQHEPLFDPSLSSSYSKGSCKSYNIDNQYLIQYGDGSYSSGLFGCDTLTLEPSDVITNFQFGCAQNSSDGFGEAAGMLGLGQGQLSLVSQTASKFGKIFLYCLPTSTSSPWISIIWGSCKVFFFTKIYATNKKTRQSLLFSQTCWDNHCWQEIKHFPICV
ncbi:hypothetical protein F0562_012124 [Nyssa sinensis]|uniref:Peptidase A1 domain-containing protein n=1 Tax=Nyssa sinensis TaxID=561372 RepID=A0A5J4ZUD4_9ASTE|nr:hypothetical protein F0562_012124 [Nyssa sinensis]